MVVMVLALRALVTGSGEVVTTVVTGQVVPERMALMAAPVEQVSPVVSEVERFHVDISVLLRADVTGQLAIGGVTRTLTQLNSVSAFAVDVISVLVTKRTAERSYLSAAR